MFCFLNIEEVSTNHLEHGVHLVVVLQTQTLRRVVLLDAIPIKQKLDGALLDALLARVCGEYLTHLRARLHLEEHLAAILSLHLNLLNRSSLLVSSWVSKCAVKVSLVFAFSKIKERMCITRDRHTH